ncbi:MAG: hypothetical protein KAW13_05440 [Dehalococcoidia bacterium]|nr:hypothetical protein [Dehalococcoidia bacterium]
MTNSNEEIKALQKRAEKAENAISKLENATLLNAKYAASNVCTLYYNVAQLFMTGTDLLSFKETWKSRRDDTSKRIGNSKTVDDIIEIGKSFIAELSKYIRAEKVKTAEEAMDIAHAFVKKYSSTALPMKATKEKDFWFVDIDVGALGTKIAKIKIDARTGDISSYEVPENQAKGEDKKG